jgi:hypothetical protein
MAEKKSGERKLISQPYAYALHSRKYAAVKNISLLEKSIQRKQRHQNWSLAGGSVW